MSQKFLVSLPKNKSSILTSGSQEMMWFQELEIYFSSCFLCIALYLYLDYYNAYAFFREWNIFSQYN